MMQIVLMIKTLYLALLTWTLVNQSLGGYDLKIVEQLVNQTNAKYLCKNSFGYDGLAILDTPGVYHYAMHLSEEHRKTRSLWIGLTYDNLTSVWMWENGQKLAGDFIYKNSTNSTAENTKVRCGMLKKRGKLGDYPCSYSRYAICGNHRHKYNEDTYTAHWSKKPSNIQNFFMTSNARSVIDCGKLCLEDVYCRLAVYQPENATCTTSTDLSPDLVEDKKSVTLIRRTI